MSDGTPTLLGEPSEQQAAPDAVEQSQPVARSRVAGALSFLKELPILVVIAIVVALAIKMLLVQPFYIPSSSMEPTLLPGDHVLVNKLVYRFGDPRQGDILVFKFPLDQSKDYIKRVVAAGGQDVELRNGKVLVDSTVVDEPYARKTVDNTTWGPSEVRAGQYFVLGDNRANSADSRVWGFLPEDNVLGKAFLVYWPPSRIGLVR